MNTRVLAVLFCSSIMASNAYAIDSVCDLSLQSRAFDTESLSTNSSIASAKRTQLCDSRYRSVQEAKSSAESGGFNLSYAGFGIGASQASVDSSGNWDISKTDFCTADAETMKAAFSQNYEKQVASVALAAWLECQRINGNALYIEYQLDPSGLFFTGQLHAPVSRGHRDLAVTGIQVEGNKEGFACNIGGREVGDGVLDQPIDLPTVSVGISCHKGDPSYNLSVSIQTDADGIPFIKMPPAATIEQVKFEELLSRVETLTAGLAKQGAASTATARSLTETIAALNGLKADLSADGKHPVQIVEGWAKAPGEGQGGNGPFHIPFPVPLSDDYTVTNVILTINSMRASGPDVYDQGMEVTNLSNSAFDFRYTRNWSAPAWQERFGIRYFAIAVRKRIL